MRTWFVKVATPLWVGLYLIIFRGFAAAIFISLSVLWGVWWAALSLLALYIIWSLLFYYVLLQSEAFEHFKDYARDFLVKKRGKVFIWIRKKFFNESDRSSISPFLILLVFAIESPLTGVPLVRYAYPKNKYLIGIFWILLGSVIEVATWYFPIYGGGLSIIRAILLWFHGG